MTFIGRRETFVLILVVLMEYSLDFNMGN